MAKLTCVTMSEQSVGKRVKRQRLSLRGASFVRSACLSTLVFLLLITSGVFGAVSGAVAQSSSPQIIFYGNQPYEIASDGSVNIYVGARDSDGRPIDMAALKDNGAIKLAENNVDITDFSLAAVPLTTSVVLVLDTSGSMLEQDGTGTARLERARKAASQFVLGLKAPVAVTVMLFNNLPTLLSRSTVTGTISLEDGAVIDGLSAGFTTDTQGIARVLENTKDVVIPTGGSGTCINDAAEAAIKIPTYADARVKTVVLLTDGKEEQFVDGQRRDGCSKASLESVIFQAQENRTQLFTLGYGAVNADNLDVSSLSHMAKDTGGVYQQVPFTGDLTPVFDEITSRLNGTFRLQYQSRLNNVTVPVNVSANLGSGIAPSSGFSLQIPALTPSIVDLDVRLDPKEGVTTTLKTVSGSDPAPVNIRRTVTLTPDFQNKESNDRASRVEYYVNDDTSPAYVTTSYPYSWEWDTRPNVEGKDSAVIKIVARAFDKAGQPAADYITSFKVVPVVDIDTGTLVLSGIGVVAILTLLLTLFLFLNRGKGGVAAVARSKPASVTKGEPLAQFIVVEGPGVTKPQEHFLYGDRSVGLGRDEDAAIQLPGERVSRQHGEILYRRNQFLYVENKTINGTLVDGQPVQKDNPIPLRDGVELYFANQTRAVFRLRQSGVAAAQNNYVPQVQAQYSPQAQQPVAASEVHTTEWVREGTYQGPGSPSPAPRDVPATYYGGQSQQASPPNPQGQPQGQSQNQGPYGGQSGQ